MKNYKSLTLLMSMLLILGACAAKKEGKTTNVTNNYNNTGSNTTNPITGAGGGVTGCSDGVARAGATRCYYTNLPTFIFSGTPWNTGGLVDWDSVSNLQGTSISPNQFRTDASFAVRIKPLVADSGPSIQGRNCSQVTKSNFDKLQVKVMLRRSSDSLGEIKTLTGAVNGTSNTARFTVPGGTTDPYVLEVISVLSNHRCKSFYGSPLSGCPNSFYDIPLSTSSTASTECVAFNLEYATDETYDLPN